MAEPVLNFNVSGIIGDRYKKLIYYLINKILCLIQLSLLL